MIVGLCLDSLYEWWVGWEWVQWDVHWCVWVSLRVSLHSWSLLILLSIKWALNASECVPKYCEEQIKTFHMTSCHSKHNNNNNNTLRQTYKWHYTRSDGNMQVLCKRFVMLKRSNLCNTSFHSFVTKSITFKITKFQTFNQIIN